MNEPRVTAARAPAGALAPVFGLLLALAPHTGAAAQEGPALSGFARSEVGLFLNESPDYAIVRNTFDLRIEGSAGPVALKVNPLVTQGPKEELEVRLREAYVALYLDKVDLRVGLQQIIWGKAEGVFITDVVSPKDLRQFLLPDFDEIRQGVTAARADLYTGPVTTELVWVPIFTPTTLPEPGSPWLSQPSYPVSPVLNPAREVAPELENSEAFLKVSYLGSTMDFELMGGWMWDDEPAPHVISLAPLTVTPQHHRLALAGGSASAAVAGAVVRGEGAFYHGKRLRTDKPAVDEGLAEVDYLHYGAGVDWSVGEISIGVQLIQQLILGYDDSIVQDNLVSTATLVVARNLLRDTLHLQVFAYFGLNDLDALLRPRLSYDLADGFTLTAGANLFLGDKGMFGQYNDNDMGYVQVKYSY